MLDFTQKSDKAENHSLNLATHDNEVDSGKEPKSHCGLQAGEI